MKSRKKQTAVKGRFSAMMISAAVHVAVLIAAGTFVAVTVVQRQEARFEGRQVARPRMQLQRLQVPQRARMERQAPQMSQRVTAQAISTRSVEFQMPEIAGLGGGIHVDMSGAGFAGSLGFSTPQLNLFGLRSQGEKILFLLDSSRAMMVDELGGLDAYKVIKNELLRMVQQLPPTTLFNIIVFDARNANQAFSEELIPATSENIKRITEWLAPLNKERDRTGLETLAFPGVKIEFEPMFPVPNEQPGWPAGISYAIQKGVDVVYWMGASDLMSWIHRDLYEAARRGQPIDPPCGQPASASGYDFDAYPGGEERWNRLVAEASRLHEAENERRRAQNLPPRVFPGGERNEWAMVRAYLPGQPTPPIMRLRVAHQYSARDLLEYIDKMMKKYSSLHSRSIGTRGRGRQMSVNVIQFVPANMPADDLNILPEVSSRLGGRFVQIRGLDAIRSHVSGER